jgi:hypothetical protein
VVGLLRLAGRQKQLEPTTTDAADKSTGKALAAPFRAAARELESASADALTGEQLVAALRRYVLQSRELPAKAVSAFVSSAALEPLQGMEKDGVLTTYLYLVATNANLAGSREWLQGHRTELAALIERLSALKSTAKAPR